MGVLFNVFVINALNLKDRIDGLAGSVAVISSNFVRNYFSVDWGTK